MARTMEDTGISARVIEEIRQLAEKYSIEQVLLFGSRARGRAAIIGARATLTSLCAAGMSCGLRMLAAKKRGRC